MDQIRIVNLGSNHTEEVKVPKAIIINDQKLKELIHQAVYNPDEETTISGVSDNGINITVEYDPPYYKIIGHGPA
jgi:hypothetical protein